MKNILWCILVLLMVSACKREHVSKPDDLISKEKMTNILYDLVLLNSIKGINKKKLEERNMHLDSYLYKKYEIDSVQFSTSNTYYAANPSEYDEIYQIVNARLKAKRGEITIEMEADKKRRDSIKDVKDAQRKKDSSTKFQKPVK